MNRRILVLTSQGKFGWGGNTKLSRDVREILRHGETRVFLRSIPLEIGAIEGVADVREFRLFDASDFDAVLALRWPSHLIRHKRKIVWFQHHRRDLFDLQGTEFGSPPEVPGSFVTRGALTRIDSDALDEAREVWAISREVERRLLRFNQVKAAAVVRVALTFESFHGLARREPPHPRRILCLNRVISIKRQKLAIEALACLPRDYSLQIAGFVESPEYMDELIETAGALGVTDRVEFLGPVSEHKKRAMLQEAEVILNLAYDEDSVSYPALEAGAARTPIVTCSDSGAILEFVENGETGLVVEPNPEAIGSAIAKVCRYRSQAMEFAERSHSAALSLTRRFHIEPIRRLMRVIHDD